MSAVLRSGLRVRAVMPGRVGRQPLQQPLTYPMAPLLGRGCDHQINPLVERCGSIVPQGLDDGQVWSSRGRTTSCRMSMVAAATGMATRAPTIPKVTPPSSTATTVTTDGISTVLPMIFGNSR
jgi:hypothetical protein